MYPQRHERIHGPVRVFFSVPSVHYRSIVSPSLNGITYITGEEQYKEKLKNEKKNFEKNFKILKLSRDYNVSVN